MPPKRQLQNPSGPATKKPRTHVNRTNLADSDPPANPNRLTELSEEINMLDTQNESLRNFLGEVQDRLASFEDKFTDFLEQA